MRIDMTTMPTFHRGEITGVQTDGPTMETRWWRCEVCSGFFDMLDFASTLEHESPDAALHPASDQVQ